MKTDKRSHFIFGTPFRPVAESARMINGTCFSVLLLAIVAASIIRREYILLSYIIPLVWAFVLERSIVFCRGAGQKGSTSHSLLQGLIVCALLPADISIYALCFTVALSILFKHFQGGLGNYLCHPALSAVVILELLKPGALALYGVTIANSPNSLTLNYQLLKAQGGADGLANIADVLANQMPGMGECLLGLAGGPLALSPVVFILTGVYFVYRGYFNWRVPLVFIAAIALAAIALPIYSGTEYHSILNAGLVADVIVTYVLYQMFTGFTIFIAAFAWLDTSSRPLTLTGQLIMAFLAGTGLIALRLYTSMLYPEAIALVLTGLLVPLLDKLTRRPASKMPG